MGTVNQERVQTCDSLAGLTHQEAIYRRMTPAARLQAACALHDFAHQRLVLQLARVAPDHSPREILIAVARRFLGDTAGIL